MANGDSYEQFMEYDEPKILENELSPLLLKLLYGNINIDMISLLTRPNPEDVHTSLCRLKEFNFIDKDHRLTEDGKLGNKIKLNDIRETKMIIESDKSKLSS
jgi:HrpA-like RNA helicase